MDEYRVSRDDREVMSSQDGPLAQRGIAVLSDRDMDIRSKAATEIINQPPTQVLPYGPINIAAIDQSFNVSNIPLNTSQHFNHPVDTHS